MKLKIVLHSFNKPEAGSRKPEAGSRGRLAQLVQSTCLTSRGSLVRIQ
jgi:hypothetical protein